jgi:hypothetical protein
MKIKFSKRRLFAHFFLGLIWASLGAYYLFFSADFPFWIGMVYAILGAYYLFYSIYDYNHPYISIEEGIVKKNKLYGLKNKIKLDEVEEIKRAQGGYLLKSNTAELKIDTSLISNKKLLKLINLFKSLNLPPDKTFLKNK